MKELIPVISIVNNEPRTLSTDVAACFEKEHYNVLRDIRQTMANCPESFNALNFECVEVKDVKGEKRPAYSMTRDGFTILAMGFTGEKALKWKIKYMEAFNKMEAELSRRMSDERAATPNFSDLVHMGTTIDYSRTLRQMARLKNYSPSQRLAFLAEAASVLSGRPANQFLPEEFDPADIPETILYARREKKIRQDALNLAALIGDREREGLPRLPSSRAGQILFGWGHGRTALATEHALKNGLLIALKNLCGKGWILATPAHDQQQNGPVGSTSFHQA